MKLDAMRMNTYATQAPELSLMDKLRGAFREAEVNFPEKIEIDGKIHRFWANPEKERTNLSGWYVFFENVGSAPAGIFGDYSRDIEQTVSTHGGRELSPAERAELEKKIRQASMERAKEREKELAIAKRECASIWNGAQPCENHPYLEKKHLQGAHGARVYEDKLILPLYNSDDEIVGLQKIFPNGEKRFHLNSQIKGSFWQVGEGKPVYLAEGYATACSIYEATGKPCAIAYNANNLVNVAKIFPDLKVVADNDESKTGERAAKETGLPYTLIPKVGYDANDYMAEFGINALKEVLEPTEPSFKLFSGIEILSVPKPKNWLIKGWIPRGPLLGMSFGPSGNGKTFVIVDRMLSIATGQPFWCGAKVNQAKVLYLCGEGSLDVRARIAVWCQEHNITDLQNFVMSEDAAHIDTPEGMNNVLFSLDYYGFNPDLIVVDTLNRFMEGDENATVDAGAFISACAKLQKTFNACVWIVHHTGLSEDAQNRARGSSAFRGALDMQDMIIKVGEAFSVEQTKNKGGREQEKVYLHLEDHDINGWIDEDGEQIRCAILKQVDSLPNQKEEQAQLVRDKNKETMIKLFIKFGFRHDDFLIIKRDHLRTYFYEYVMEREPESKNPRKSADMTLKRLLDPLLEEGSLTPFEKDINGKVVSYKTTGFKGGLEGILEPFFSFSLSRGNTVTSGNK